VDEKNYYAGNTPEDYHDAILGIIRDSGTSSSSISGVNLSFLPPPALMVYPNPFSGTGNLAWNLPVAGQFSAEIFDIRGQRIQRFGTSFYEKGEHGVSWNGRNLRGEKVLPGFYFLRLASDQKTHTRRFAIVK